MSGCRQASAAEAVLLFSSKLQPEDGQKFLSTKAVLRIWLSRYFSGSGSVPGLFESGFNITPDLVVASKMLKKLIVEANYNFFGSTTFIKKGSTSFR
jgi:hypothetical protein